MYDITYTKALSVNEEDCDMFGRLRPASMLKLMQEAGREHLDSWETLNSRIRDRGLLWVISRTTAEISRLPVSREQLTLVTWPGKNRHAFLPRSFELRDDKGRVAVRAKSVYILMDKESRHAVTPKSMGIDFPQRLDGEELPDLAPRIPFPAELPGTLLRAPRYSELDVNGHLNNTHYLSWGEDLLGVDYHRHHALRTLRVEYRREVRPEDAIEMRYALEDDVLYVKGGEYFAIKMEYGK